MRTKVNFIVGGDRVAGYTTAPKPPNKLIGKMVTITRELIGWHGYWCKFKGEEYVFSHAELNLSDCDCRDCLKTKEMTKDKKHGRRSWDLQSRDGG